MREFHKIVGKKYRYSETLETNISTQYLGDKATNWGVWEMMRECFQNVMDEAQVQAEAKGGHLSDHLIVNDWIKVDGESWWQIADKGRGADLHQILYLGLSGKRNQNLRGEKGEGQLLAFLVAVKEEIGMFFVSQDYAIKPFISKENGHDHLALAVYRTNKPIKGTRVLIEKHNDVEYYIEDRKYFFPDLKKPRKQREKTHTYSTPTCSTNRKAFKPRDGQPSLYLKGIYVKKINALLSYNLQESRISRDRDFIDEEDLIQEIGPIWGAEKNISRLTVLIREATSWDSNKIEMRVTEFNPEHRDAWRSAFRKVAGARRAVLWTDDIIAREAYRKGYAVLKVERSAIRWALECCNIKLDSDVAQKTDPYRELKTDYQERRLFKTFTEIASLCSWGDREFKVFKTTGSDSRYDNRLAFHNNGTEYFLRSFIKTSCFQTLLKVFVHEETHRMYGAPDESREFESGQAELWMNIVKYAAVYVNEQMKKWGGSVANDR